MMLTSVLGCAVKSESPISLSIAFAQPGDTPPLKRTIGKLDYEISEIYIVVSVVEMHLCQTLASFSFVPNAYAHVSSSSTRLGTPFVIALHKQKQSAIVVGEIAPPPGEYCKGFVVLSPADEDVMNLTDLDSQKIIGHSIFIRGRFKELSSVEWTPFEKSFDLKDAFPFPLLRPKTGLVRLQLEPGSHEQITIDFNWPQMPAQSHPEDPDFGIQIVNELTKHLKMRSYKK